MIEKNFYTKKRLKRKEKGCSARAEPYSHGRWLNRNRGYHTLSGPACSLRGIDYLQHATFLAFGSKGFKN